MRKIFYIPAVLGICLVMISGCIKSTLNQSVDEVMKIDGVHNGDAKFYNDQYIVTSINGILSFIEIDNPENIIYFSDIRANWIDSISEDGIVIYANALKQTGILHLDENLNMLSNNIILSSEHLLIDPSIIKVDNAWYMTNTEIEGNVNNADPNQKSGNYAVKLYRSEDLNSWEFINDIVKHEKNLEDVDLRYYGHKLYLFFEKEEYDKGKSSIQVTSSENIGKSWEPEKELIPSDADNEPAVIRKKGDQYELFYSSDKEKPGTSYSGAAIYKAQFDLDFNKAGDSVKIPINGVNGILLYDVQELDGKQVFLLAEDYLGKGHLRVHSQG